MLNRTDMLARLDVLLKQIAADTREAHDIVAQLQLAATPEIVALDGVPVKDETFSLADEDEVEYSRWPRITAVEARQLMAIFPDGNGRWSQDIAEKLVAAYVSVPFEQLMGTVLQATPNGRIRMIHSHLIEAVANANVGVEKTPRYVQMLYGSLQRNASKHDMSWKVVASDGSVHYMRTGMERCGIYKRTGVDMWTAVDHLMILPESIHDAQVMLDAYYAALHTDTPQRYGLFSVNTDGAYRWKMITEWGVPCELHTLNNGKHLCYTGAGGTSEILDRAFEVPSHQRFTEYVKAYFERADRASLRNI